MRGVEHDVGEVAGAPVLASKRPVSSCAWGANSPPFNNANQQCYFRRKPPSRTCRPCLWCKFFGTRCFAINPMQRSSCASEHLAPLRDGQQCPAGRDGFSPSPRWASGGPRRGGGAAAGSFGKVSMSLVTCTPDNWRMPAKTTAAAPNISEAKHGAPPMPPTAAHQSRLAGNGHRPGRKKERKKGGRERERDTETARRCLSSTTGSGPLNGELL